MTIDNDLPDFSITGIAERDIDLLLLEEFIASPDFARWFASRVCNDFTGDITVIAAHRSVTQSTGESDLEVVLSLSQGATHYLLIENKIGAAFQPQQASRYRERGSAYQQAGRCTSYSTVLVAPDKYLGHPQRNAYGFDASISYEDIAAWFHDHPALGPRLNYKQGILASAIEKAVHGYQAIEDAQVSSFWHSYWRLSLRVAPELEMPEPSAKPSRAGFVYFRPGALPREVCIVHKLRPGHLDLQFAGMASQLSEIRATLGTSLISGMTIERAGRSAVIRQKVQPFNTAADFQSQEAGIAACLLQARELLRWYLRSAARTSDHAE